jgi:DNA-binding IclR family transcriptional regulator
MPQANNPVGSVRTSLSIVRQLRQNDGAGVTELATELQVSKGTVHNHLMTLQEDGIVVKRGEEFELGLRFFEFGEYVRARHTIYEIGEPEVEKLADQTSELANLLVEEHGQGFYLHRAKGEQALSLDTGVGSRVTLHNTALGKSILAHLPEQRVETILDEHGMEPTTPHTITERDELYDRLETIREQGYAYDREERAEGVRCVASPVLTSDGTVQGAVSVAGPAGRMKGERFETEIPEMVQKAANVVGINLTYAE